MSVVAGTADAAPSPSKAIAPSTGVASPNARASVRLDARKQPGEAEHVFFDRAAHEIARNASTETRGRLTDAGHAALERIARDAGFHAIRQVVLGDGVKGSKSDNGYGKFYRNGWTAKNVANLRAPDDVNGPKPVLHQDRALERDIRAMLGKTATGREALARLDRSRMSIRFCKGGGTVIDPDSGTLIIDRQLRDGTAKPVSWLAVSVAHEATHAWDEVVGAKPKFESKHAEAYRQAKAQAQVPMELRKQLIAERRNYVDRMVSSEARAMSKEVEVMRELEAGGISFDAKDARLDRTLSDAYKRGYESVYHSAGLSVPASTTP